VVVRRKFVDQVKQIAYKEFPLAPEEFDFRGRVRLAVLHLASFYEYGRGADWLVKKFGHWHSQRIALPRTSKEFKKWNHQTVGDVVACARTVNLSEDVFNALTETYPPWLSQYPYEELREISPFFPMPFVLVPEPALELLAHLAPRPQGTGFISIQTLPNLVPAMVARYAEMGRHYGAFVANIQVGKTKFVKDVATWAGDFFDKHSGGKFRLPTGAAGAPPWHELRELGAFRFRKAGLSFEKTRDFLEYYLKFHPTPPKPPGRSAPVAMKKAGCEEAQGDVLPNYTSSGSFHDAADSADARIKKWFPEPLPSADSLDS
jgi:hypothetical protein